MRDEVRRCSRCGRAALITVQEWQRRLVGIGLPAKTAELRCQSCGYKVLLYPKHTIRAARIMAYLMLPAVFPSIYYFALARRQQRAWTDNPVVDGAPRPKLTAATAMPRDESGAALPYRRCECAAAAPCVRIALKGWSIRLGANYDYACDRCGKRFTISSPRYLVTLAAIATMLLALGILMIVAPPGSAVGAAQSNRWFGVALAVLGAALMLVWIHRVRVRLAHPVVRET